MRKLICIATLGLVLAVFTPCSHAAPTASLQTEEGPACDDLPSLLPGTDRCAFVREHCDGEGRIPLLNIYFCLVQPLGKVLEAITIASCAFLLVILFKLMGHAADEYFSSILSQISQDMGLPPRLGGVTLLALGNGAPDLSSSIAAVRSGNSPLALGALTGGSMFVGCVVAGRIVTLNGGVRSRGAQIRDVMTQFLAVATVTIIVASGKVTYGAIAGLLFIYVAYVIVVAVADFSKRAGVKWRILGRDLTQQISLRFRSRGLATPLLDRAGSTLFADQEEEQAAENGFSRPRSDDGENLLLPEGEISVTEGLLPTVTQVPPLLVGDQTRSSGSPNSLGASSEVEMMITPPVTGGRGPVRNSHSLPTKLPSAEDFASEASNHESLRNESNNTRRAQTNAPDYDEIVHMTAREYRQRALADMAAATSFYRKGAAVEAAERLGIVGESEGEDSESEEEEEGEEALLESRERREGAENDSLRDLETGEGRGRIRGYTPPEIRLVGSEGLSEESREAAAGAAAAGPSSETRPPSRGLVRQVVSAPAEVNLPCAGGPLPQVPIDEVGPGTGTRTRGGFGPGRAIMVSGLARAARLNEFLDKAASPVVFLLKATVPIVEMSSYERPWFLLAMTTSPLFFCAYLGAWSFHSTATALAIGCVSAAVCAVATRGLGDVAPSWSFGTKIPLGAGLIALYGFAVAALWIDIFASEIVGVLHFFGLLAGVEPAVLGVTVLAWGNSLTDFVANTTMAGRSAGGTSMAMTACFAGPLFNMLVGLGIGFWSYLADTKQRSTPVHFDSVVAVGCAFAMLNCAGVTAVAMKNKHRLPGRFGWVMVGWYGLYMAAVLAIVLS